MLVTLTPCHLPFLSPQIVKTINAKISNNDGRLGPVYPDWAKYLGPTKKKGPMKAKNAIK